MRSRSHSHSQLPMNCAWTSSGGGRRGDGARCDCLTRYSSESSWVLNGDCNTSAEVFLQGDLSRSEWPCVISRLWLVCPSESSFYPQYWSNIHPASYWHRPDGSNGCVTMSHPAIWGHKGKDHTRVTGQQRRFYRVAPTPTQPFLLKAFRCYTQLCSLCGQHSSFPRRKHTRTHTSVVVWQLSVSFLFVCF